VVIINGREGVERLVINQVSLADGLDILDAIGAPELGVPAEKSNRKRVNTHDNSQEAAPVLPRSSELLNFRLPRLDFCVS